MYNLYNKKEIKHETDGILTKIPTKIYWNNEQKTILFVVILEGLFFPSHLFNAYFPFLPDRFSVLGRSQTYLLLERPREHKRILVSHILGDFCDRCIGNLQLFMGAGDSKIRKIITRR